MSKHSIFKKPGWIIVIGLVIIIQLISINPQWVEKYYSYGIYPPISIVQRFLFGWIPFSIGDILYAVVVVYLLYKIIRVVSRFRKSKIRKEIIWNGVRKIIYVALWVFVIFYGLWGLNYSRAGIAAQLHLKEQQYNIEDLDTLVHILHDKLNDNAAQLTPAMRDSFKTKRNLFDNAIPLYQNGAKHYPFLSYKVRSVKPSLFSYLGNYLGFQGYYNPFTGEAQVNTTIPQSETPFVLTHEMAHQLGYAKESEANFVAFLTCRLHPSVNFKYSVYFDMYHYSISRLWYTDSVKANVYDSTLHPQVKRDEAVYRSFYKKYRNPIEPYISAAYGYFLKANNQPKGRESYGEVVNWLIAYYKKYGKEAL